MLSDEMLSVIWSPAKHDPEWKNSYLQVLQERCRFSANNVGEWLCGQRALRSFPLKQMRALENQLENSTLRNTLRDVTFRARQFNTSLPLARIAIEIQRPPNPINPDLYTPDNLSASRELIESLERLIRLDLEQLNAHGRVGLLLLSAAYLGGLLDIPQLNALIQLDPGRIAWISQIPEVRLSLSIRGQPAAEQRQWFPDPTTLALLSRCAQDLAESRSYLTQRDAKLLCIREALSAAGMSAHNLPDRTERRIDAQSRNEIDGNRDFRLAMQGCVAALRLPVRMSVEQVSGCWWTECPDGVESAHSQYSNVRPARLQY